MPAVRTRAGDQSETWAIDCYFHDGDLSKSEILEEQIIENCLREDLQPIDQAKAFSALMELNDLTAKTVAETLRVHPATVSRALALLRLPDDIQKQVADGSLAASSAYEISKLRNGDRQRELATANAAKGLTRTETARAVRKQSGRKAKKRRQTHETFVLPDGWKVTVTSKTSGNYAQIEKALEEALEEVRHRIANGVVRF